MNTMTNRTARAAAIAFALAAGLSPAAAKSVSSTISIGTFDARCRAAGGTLTMVSAGGHKCRLPSGQVVTCYDTDGPGISCDYRALPQAGIKQLFGQTLQMK